jgi:hypothetical protein
VSTGVKLDFIAKTSAIVPTLSKKHLDAFPGLPDVEKSASSF